MALLVLLARPARTRIVASDLRRLPPERLDRLEMVVVMPMVMVVVAVRPVHVPGMAMIVLVPVIMVVVAPGAMHMAVRMAMAVSVVDAAVCLHGRTLVGRAFAFGHGITSEFLSCLP